MPEHDLFFDISPARYAKYYYDRCMAWWGTQQKRVQENYDMAQGYDEYMQSKAAMGYSSLTVPTIYIVAESRVSAMWELLSREEPFFRFDPLDNNDTFARIAAERKETAMQHMRRDLRWNDEIMDLFYACEFSNHAWLALETQEIKIGPSQGLFVTREEYGMPKTYPTFKLYGPGEIIVDGFHKNSSLAPAKVKFAFLPYHALKMMFPQYVDKWILKYAKRREDSAYYNPDLEKKKDEGYSSAYYKFQNRGEGASEWDADIGFLVAELHVSAVYSDGNPRKTIYTFLPEVTSGPDSSQNYSWGYPLCHTQGIPFPYQSIDDLIIMARARRQPFTMDGRCTSELLYSMQREISDSIASERDLDRAYLQPVMAVRSKFLAGKEQPSWEPGSTWSFQDPEGSDALPLRDLVQPLHTQTPNRGYAAATRAEMQGLAELIGAALEATTGAQGSGDETLGKFQARNRGGAGRINLVFTNHAQTLIQAADSIMAMMAEAEEVYLQPPIRTNSQTLGRPSALTSSDILTPSKLGIPGLEKYAAREQGKVLAMTLAEVLVNNPAFAQSMEANVMLVEDTMRQMGVEEMRIQEYRKTLNESLMSAMMANAMTAIPPEIGAGAGAPGNTKQSPMLARAQGGMGGAA